MTTKIPGFRVPESFWKAFGYIGDARLVLINWTSSGTSGHWYDGLHMSCDADWQALLFLLSEPHNDVALKRALHMEKVHETALGGAGQIATHGILVDRSRRRSYLTPMSLARLVIARPVNKECRWDHWDYRASAQPEGLGVLIEDLHAEPPNCCHIINGWTCMLDGSTCPGRCDNFELFQRYDVNACFGLMMAYADRCWEDGDQEAIRDLKDLLGVADDRG